jgi:hypothetical protein
MPTSRSRPYARCIKCGHVALLRAFEVEVALSADDSGDNDWVINFSCPACEAADRPDVLGDGRAAAALPVPSLGVRANPTYDPSMP